MTRTRTLLWVASIILTSVSLVRVASAQAAPSAPTDQAAEAPVVAPPDSAPAQAASPTSIEELRRELNARVAELEQEVAKVRAERDAEREAQPTAEPAGAPDEAELDALLAQGELESAATEEESVLRIYGFFDLGLSRLFIPKTNANSAFVGPSGTTFLLGNLNTYIDVRPSPDWQGLLELRYTPYPSGTVTQLLIPGSDDFERTNTTVVDSNAPTGRNRITWSGIFIERAYIQWAPRTSFTLRVGQFLTPYGIWNVDHGSPTLIANTLPVFFASEFFPTRQVGIEALGSVHLDPWEVGYHLTVSNGRTPSLRDATDNKSFGSRVFLRRAMPYPFTLGASGYYGQYEDYAHGFANFLPPRGRSILRESYDEYAVAADVSIDIDRLRLRAEFVMNRKMYEKEGRGPATYGPPGGVLPDSYQTDAYLLAAYEITKLHLEPFVWLEVARRPSAFGPDGLFIPSVGTNIRFTPAVTLKAQYLHLHVFNFGDGLALSKRKTDFSSLDIRLVMAF